MLSIYFWWCDLRSFPSLCPLYKLSHILCCQLISDEASPNELKLQSSYDNDKIDNQPWRRFWWRWWWCWTRKQRNVTLDRILSMLLSPRPWSRPSPLPPPSSHPLTRRRGRCLAHLPRLLLWGIASCESWFRLSADAGRILHTPCFDKELVHCFLFPALRKVTTDKEICGCFQPSGRMTNKQTSLSSHRFRSHLVVQLTSLEITLISPPGHEDLHQGRHKGSWGVERTSQMWP